jgi:hypothetical protein
MRVQVGLAERAKTRRLAKSARRSARLYVPSAGRASRWRRMGVDSGSVPGAAVRALKLWM